MSEQIKHKRPKYTLEFKQDAAKLVKLALVTLTKALRAVEATPDRLAAVAMVA